MFRFVMLFRMVLCSSRSYGSSTTCSVVEHSLYCNSTLLLASYFCSTGVWEPFCCYRILSGARWYFPLAILYRSRWVWGCAFRDTTRVLISFYYCSCTITSVGLVKKDLLLERLDLLLALPSIPLPRYLSAVSTAQSTLHLSCAGL